MTGQNIAAIRGLSEIVDRYDAFLVDLWGCLHDGVRPYPGAVDVLTRLRASGRKVCLLSNGPRRVASIVRRLERMGVPLDIWDEALSSGEATWAALAERSDPWHAALGRRCYHLGPERDNDVREGNGLEIVAEVAEAEFILATGISHEDQTVADFADVLEAGIARRLPMVCANPDLVVHIGEKLTVCAGLIAQRYEEMGGDVRYHGKPHPGVYARCATLLGRPDPRRVLGIGDSLRTDVAGATGVGHDSLLLTAGIHREEFAVADGSVDVEKVARAAARDGLPAPTWAMPQLVW